VAISVAISVGSSRALELLASCRDGCTEAIMLAHGFTVQMLVEMVRAGLASVSTEPMVVGGRTMEVARVRITEAGRRALGRARPMNRNGEEP
jgi:hypothetical protein